MADITYDRVLNLIKRDFKGKKFTVGDIYYSFESSFNRSRFGTIRNILVKISKQKILNFSIEIRGSPKFNSERKRKGVVYALN